MTLDTKILSENQSFSKDELSANQTKVAGPILRGLQDLLLPVVFKYLVHPETETWLYHYRIDWDEQGSTEVVSTS